MNRLVRLICAIALGGSFTVHAQGPGNAQEAPPSPPYIAPVPTPVSWNIQISYPEPPPPESRFLKEVRVTKTRDKKREISTWSDGIESETWYMDGHVIYRQPHFLSDDVAVVEEATYFAQGDFPNLFWVNKDTYKRQEIREGRLCYYYESDPSAVPGRVSASLQGQLQRPPVFKAWIDVKTKLPVVLDQGKLIEKYSFSAGTSQSISLPPLFARKLEQFLATKKAVLPLPPSY